MSEAMIYVYPEGHENHFERGHPERPERVETIRTALLNAGLWNGYPKLPAITPTDDLIQSIHSPTYLNLLEMTCRRAGHLDPDTFTTPATWDLPQRAAYGDAPI